jgi:hypothetical protein
MPRVWLQAVQFEEIREQEVHSGGHIWHMKKVELSMELAGQEETPRGG